MNLTQRAAKGEKANEILNNEIFVEAMDNLRSAIISNWQKCNPGDKDKAHELLIMIKLMDGLESNIKTFIVDGKKARFEIEEQKKREDQQKKGRKVV